QIVCSRRLTLFGFYVLTRMATAIEPITIFGATSIALDK
ncbi:MAG: hypothetical protein RLZZ139_650, partial [Cyanobacteriota bacterium]